MQNGNYNISVNKTENEECYMQLIGENFKVGAAGVVGGTSGAFRVTTNPSNDNQIAMHVQLNENTGGYVNSFTNLGEESVLVIGAEAEYFNVTADGEGYEIHIPLEIDNENIECYFTVWSQEGDNAIYLDQQNPNRSGTDRPTQKWKFRSIVTDDIVREPSVISQED